MCPDVKDDSSGSLVAAYNARIRYEVNLPISVTISRSVMTDPFRIRDAVLLDIGRLGSKLFLTIKVVTQREELPRILGQRRRCAARCQLPGFYRATSASGEIVWVEPRVTSRGVVVRFGVNVDESDPKAADDLCAYLCGLEAKSRARPPE